MVWTSHYYHADALGSTREMTDSSESVIDHFLHDAWGAEKGRSGVTPTPFTWVGKYGYFVERTCATYQIRNRTFDSMTARFASKDQLWPVGGSNAYSYAGLSPIANIDPSGLILVTQACALRSTGRIVMCFDDCDAHERALVSAHMCDAAKAIEDAASDVSVASQFFGQTPVRADHRAAIARVSAKVDYWFGDWERDPATFLFSVNPAKKATLQHVTQVLNAMAAAFAASTPKYPILLECDSGLNYGCWPTKSTPAYTQGAGVFNKNDIHFCPYFWTLNRQEQIRFLIHELSHRYGYTVDSEYYNVIGAVSGHVSQIPPRYERIGVNALPTDQDKLASNADTYGAFVVDTYNP